jgi:DNA polymerase zeta
MVRIAKPESFMLLSPNRQQVGRQAAVEATPLVMEPKSAYYKGPMVVLDFTSLYPSVMCAYNYCYSTCLGRVRHTDRSPNLGVTDYDIPPGLLAAVKDEITISPNGFMFVKENVRKSLLAKMLTELLDTRVMVKSSMKGQEDDVPLTRLLNARQLALKFIANVSFSLAQLMLHHGAVLTKTCVTGHLRIHDCDCVRADADGRVG